MACLPAATAVDNGAVLVLITLVVLPIAAIAFARSGPLWRSIGRGPMSIDQDLSGGGTRAPAGPTDPAIQAAEARQMLEAKSYRRELRGEGPLDVEEEVRKLLEPAAGGAESVDEELRAEVRRLVIAGNERRLRRGEAQLNVEEETERQLEDFIGSG